MKEHSSSLPPLVALLVRPLPSLLPLDYRLELPVSSRSRKWLSFGYLWAFYPFILLCGPSWFKLHQPGPTQAEFSESC